MRICFKLQGKVVCFNVPVLRIPWEIPGPGPVESQGLLHDAVILRSMHEAAANISDPRVKKAVGESLGAGMKAFKASAGPNIEIHLDERAAATA